MTRSVRMRSSHLHVANISQCAGCQDHGRIGKAHAQARELPNRQNLCPCDKEGPHSGRRLSARSPRACWRLGKKLRSLSAATESDLSSLTDFIGWRLAKLLARRQSSVFLVSAQSNREKARSPYDAEADAIREKTERLRKLRLAKEAEEKRLFAASDGVPAKSRTEKPSRADRIATRAKPATLADWLVDRERDGFRN